MSIDYDGQYTNKWQPGYTYQPSSIIEMIVSSTLFYNNDGLYLAAGHEIIHARDYDSGFMSSIDRKYTQREVRDVIKEYRAYLWSSPKAGALGHWSSGHQSEQLQSFIRFQNSYNGGELLKIVAPKYPF